MQNAPITIKNVRPQFYTREGRSKKEHLVTLMEAAENSGIFFSQEKYEAYYQRQRMHGVLTKIKNNAYAHNENFVTPKFPGSRTRYGFTKDFDCIQNSITRIEQRAEHAQMRSSEVKAIGQQQLLLLSE